MVQCGAKWWTFELGQHGDWALIVLCVRARARAPTNNLPAEEGGKKNPPAKLQNRNEDPFPQIKDQKWLQLGRGQRETEIVFPSLRRLGKGKTAHFRTEQNWNVSLYVFCLRLVAGSWLSADAWEWKRQSGRSCLSNGAPHVDCYHLCKTKKN